MLMVFKCFEFTCNLKPENVAVILFAIATLLRF